jgi:hypothetical protein
MLSNWAELYAKSTELTGVNFRKLFRHKEFRIFVSQVGAIIFLFGRIGQAGQDGPIMLFRHGLTPRFALRASDFACATPDKPQGRQINTAHKELHVKAICVDLGLGSHCSVFRVYDTLFTFSLLGGYYTI